MARHIEQPGSRHSNPACLNITSRPSSSACFLTRPDPGTTNALTLVETFFPLIISAADLISSILELVHEPMKTVFISTSLIFWPGVNPIYSIDLLILFCLTSSEILSGFGTVPSILTISSGLVPHVIVCVTLVASMSTILSNFAPESEGRVFHQLTALSQSSFFGAIGFS